MKQQLKVVSISPVTRDVYRIVTEKPPGISYVPGQAADITLDKQGWEDEMRPFTFTSLPDDNHLEFTIKTYPAHNGVTNQIRSMKPGDAFVLHGVFGDISYKGEGIFIAGGAGVTPFIAIFRELKQRNKVGNNKLIFANKTRSDIINEDEFRNLLGANFINVLSEEAGPGDEKGFVTPELIRKHLEGRGLYFYLCGPPPMMDALNKHLAVLKIGEEFIVREAF